MKQLYSAIAHNAKNLDLDIVNLKTTLKGRHLNINSHEPPDFYRPLFYRNGIQQISQRNETSGIDKFLWRTMKALSALNIKVILELVTFLQSPMDGCYLENKEEKNNSRTKLSSCNNTYPSLYFYKYGKKSTIWSVKSFKFC